ncbi:M14 family zinc carboxypeptidase [Micromonospora zhanjiangensis]|uniref:M14 family zinc carboxypeptidase n=1 Tax=Micromonospora zhanjiangensis TaxID=1522057 RepID=A0ABV8KPE1_9ACTN
MSLLERQECPLKPIISSARHPRPAAVVPSGSRWPRRVAALGTAVALSVSLATAAAAAPDPKPGAAGNGLAIAKVKAGTKAERQKLMDLGLDVIDLTDTHAEVLLRGAADRAQLAGGHWQVEQVSDATDQLAAMAADRVTEARREAARRANPTSRTLAAGLPSGRVSYRTLDEAEQEMRELERGYPDKVKVFELSRKSLLGHAILGMEISSDVRADSGKPVFLTTGLHHAREWPTLEFTMEFARDVLQNYATDSHIKGLVDSSRLIVVPAVNPGGYQLSRDLTNEMKRKNCRVAAGRVPTRQQCAAASSQQLGVDLNRNYAAFWGGPGSSASTTAETHYGAAPTSEPEIAALTDLLNSRQVVVAVNNHTPDARLLRAPASPLEPVPAEVALYDGLARQLGAALGGWPTGPWPDVYYVASGVAEQEGLYANGTLGFTPELTPGHDGLERFHPRYQYVIDQYRGTGYYAGSSIRDALLIAWDAANDPRTHSILTGSAPPGIELTISKDVTVNSSPVDRNGRSVVLPSALHIQSTMRVPAGGRFEWHVLPSLRQSQQTSTLLQESWVVSCRNSAGEVQRSVRVTIGRGETKAVDMSGCPAG